MPRHLPVIFLILCISCQSPVQEQKQAKPDAVSEQFIRANQYMQRRHQDHIAAFVERVGWSARKTPSGLWIVVKKPGNGVQVEEGDRVTYTFESMLLDGTPCYSAGVEDPKSIIVGQGGVESGVEEGLLMMQQGTEATLLIPPHLGHGNFGDRNRIPGNTVLIYHLKVIGVEKR